MLVDLISKLYQAAHGKAGNSGVGGGGGGGGGKWRPNGTVETKSNALVDASSSFFLMQKN